MDINYISKKLYNYILEKCGEMVPVTEHGQFGADMQVALVNDGPFTVMLDSQELFKMGTVPRR